MAVGVRTLEAGRALIKLALDDDALRSGLRSTERRIKTIGRNLASAGAAVAGVGAAITAAFIPAIQAASKLQESTSKFNTVFGNASDDVRAWGNALAEEVGRSRGQINSFLADTQAFFVPLGFDEKEALRFSKTITKLSVDLASFFDKADERQVLRDLQSGFAGSLETLDKYSVVLRQVDINQRLLNEGIDPKTATQAQKATALLSLILERTAKAQGDAKRTSEEFANQLKRFKGQVTDLAATIGSALLPPLSVFLKEINAMIKPLGEWAKNNQTIVVAIAATGVAIAAAGAGLIVFGAVATGASAALGALAAVSGVVSTALATLASPVGLIAVGLAALVLSSEKVRDALGELASTTLREVKGAIKAVSNAFAAGDIGLAFEVFANQIVLTLTRGLSEGLKVALGFIPGLLSETLGNAITGSIDSYFGGFIEDLEKKQARLRNESFKARKETEKQAAAQRDAARAIGDTGVKADDLADIYKKLAKEAANSEAAIRRQAQVMVDAAKRLGEETLTPLERFRKKQEEIQKLLEKGLISDEVAGRGIIKAREEFEKTDRITQRLNANLAARKQREAERVADLTAEAQRIKDSLRTPIEALEDEVEAVNQAVLSNLHLFTADDLAKLSDQFAERRKELEGVAAGFQGALRDFDPIFGAGNAESIFGENSQLETLNKRMLKVQQQSHETNKKIERNTRNNGATFQP